MNLRRDREQWRALVNMVMDFLESSSEAAQLAASQEGLSSMSDDDVFSNF
jgi:hypothetical protein